jgi:hypothetical protein
MLGVWSLAVWPFEVLVDIRTFKLTTHKFWAKKSVVWMHLMNLVEEADQGSYWTCVYPKSWAEKTESCELYDWWQIYWRSETISLCTLLWMKCKLCVSWSELWMFQWYKLCMCEDLCVYTDWGLHEVWKRRDQRIAI